MRTTVDIDLANRAVEAAIEAGAGDAEAYASEAARREVRAHGGAVESLGAATQRGIGVRAWIEGRVGYGFGTDFSPSGIVAIAARAVAAARVADPDHHAGPPSEPGEPALVTGMRDPSVAELSTEAAAEMAIAVERAAVGFDRRILGVEQAVYVDSDERVAIAGSSGAVGEYEDSSCYAYAQALADGGASRETGLGFGLARGPAGLDPAAIGREAGERASEMIGSGKPASRACPVVLDATVAASFVSLVGGALGANAVQRGRSPLAGMIGESVASEAFALRDDGLDPQGFASAPVDAEGVPRRRTSLIEEGRLLGYLYDTYTARRGDAESTGNAGRSGYRGPPSVSASNLIVSPGELGFDGLLEEAGDGVFVSDVAGLHAGVNPVSGVFSVGASGRAIRDGALAEPLREFTIASDLISMLRAIRAVGASPRWVPFGGSVSVPPLLIGEMAIGGS
jgi:PmbA protein